MFMDSTSLCPWLLENPDNLALAAAVLAAILFLNLIFIFNEQRNPGLGRNMTQSLPEQFMHSDVFGMALQRLRKYFAHLLQHVSRTTSEAVNEAMLVWLAFTSALAGEVRPITNTTLDIRFAFIRLCSHQSTMELAEIKKILSLFLYDANLMDGYLAGLCAG